MLYVFPVSKSDAHLIEPLYQAIKTLGGLKGRKCLVVGDQQARDDVDWLADRLEHLDGIVQKHVFPFRCEDGWPRACNRYFIGAAAIAAHQDEPFYYFELDNTPIRAPWLERIEGEYIVALSKGQFFMGRMSDFVENRMGRWVVDGQMMNGSGVYPSNFVGMSTLAKEVGRIDIPWDVYMRWEIVNSCRDTSQFTIFNWKTTNYRWEDGQIKCDISSRPQNIQHSGKTYLITPDTYLVHGCKDGSLAGLVVSGEIDAQRVVEKHDPAPAPEKSTAPAARKAPTKKVGKPKKSSAGRKLNLTPEERARRAQHARNVAKTRKPKGNDVVPVAA